MKYPIPFGILAGEAKTFRHGKAKTLYVGIPSGIVLDSAFAIKEGETVVVEYDKDQNVVTIRPMQQKEQSSSSKTEGKGRKR